MPFQENFRIRNNILQQPGLAMDCDRREKTCKISLNRLLQWKPDTVSLRDSPEMTRQGQTWYLKEELKKLGHEHFLTFKPAVFVTCHGVRGEDQEELEGMKLDRPGFEASSFPWGGNVTEEKQVVILNLVESRVNSVEKEQEVKVGLVCAAWARNIRTSGFPVRITDLFSIQRRHTLSRNGAVTKWICFKGWQMGEAKGMQKECQYYVKD